MAASSLQVEVIMTVTNLTQKEMNELKSEVLQERMDYLCNQLGDPRRYFPALRSKGVLTYDDCERVKSKVTSTEKVRECGPRRKLEFIIIDLMLWFGIIHYSSPLVLALQGMVVLALALVSLAHLGLVIAFRLPGLPINLWRHSSYMFCR